VQYITSTFGLSQTQLQTLNPFLQCDPSPGTIIQVKGAPNFVSCSYKDVVQPGDTCSVIAVRNGITLQQLQALNPTMQCSSLSLYQRLCVQPGQLAVSSPFERSCGAVYLTQDGDTGDDILQNTDVSQDILFW
jgi:hypothetical protein